MVCLSLAAALQIQQMIWSDGAKAPGDNSEAIRLRAYIHINRFVKADSYLRVIVINRGLTPASALTGKITYHWLPGDKQDLPEGFVFDERPLPPGSAALLGSQQERSIRFEIDPQRFRLANEGELTLFVLVRITYSDVFGHNHALVESVRYARNGQGEFGFESYGNYSHAD